MATVNNTIDLSFVKEFESEVHLDYQRFGAKMLNTVRRKNITAEDTTFQTIGKAVSGQKARNGQVPINNLRHTPVPCPVADYYTGEFVDKLDLLKINHDERQAVARSLSAAQGRQSDDLIIQAADAATRATTTTGGLTLPKVEEVFEAFGNDDVPDDGQRVMWVSPRGWTDLMNLPEFSNADYIPRDELPYPVIGYSAKRFMSFLVMQHSGLNKAGNIRTCLAYHRSALGCAVNSDIYLDVTWQGKEQAWLLVSGMSQGAVIIDDLGVYHIEVDES